MENTASNTSRAKFTQLCQHLHLGRTLEGAYGLGVTSPQTAKKIRKAAWTAEQLLAMSEAKSFYN